MDLLGPRERLAGARHPDRLPRQALGLREDAFEHPEPGERREDLGPLRARFSGDQLDRAPGRHDRARRITGGATHVGEPFVQQSQPDSVPASVQSGGGGLEIRRGTRRPPDGVGGLGRPDLQLGDVDRGEIALPARARGRRDRRVDRQGELEGGQLVGGRVPVAGIRGGPDRRVTRPFRLVSVQPVASGSHRRPVQPRGQGDEMARSQHGQHVALHGSPDRFVAEADLPVSLDDEAMLERFGQSRAQVRVEDAVAVTRARARARRGTLALGFERRGDLGKLLWRQGPTGRCQQAQHAAAFGRANGRAGHDQVVEGIGQRRRRQLAPSREQLFDHQRNPTGTLDDQESRLAEARSPSMPSMNAARSSRSSADSDRRSTEAVAEVDADEIEARSSCQGWSLDTRSG